MDFQPLVRFLDNYLPMLGIPGADTSVYLGREEVFRYQSGYDSPERGTPVRPDALYNIYSCSKPATMCALLSLMERGEISITDPVYAYLPEFRDLTYRVKKEDGTYDIAPCKNVMTVRQLMNMTSGLDYNLDTPAIREVKARTDGRCPTVEIASALARSPLSFEPGTDFQYSLGHDVIGAIVEVVSGKRFGDYMKEAVFDPIGMRDTSFDPPESEAYRFATQYELLDGRAVEVPFRYNHLRPGPDYESGGAGIITTVADYALFTDTLTHMGLAKNGNRILAPSSIDLLRTNTLVGRPMETYTRWGVLRLGYGYGLGVRVNMEPALAGNPAAVGEFGWDGYKLSYLSADPKNEVSIFHAEHLGHYNSLVIPRLRSVVYACLGI